MFFKDFGKKSGSDKVWAIIAMCLYIFGGLYTILAIAGRWIFPAGNVFYASIDIFTYSKDKEVEVLLLSLSYLIEIQFITYTVRMLLSGLLPLMSKGGAIVNLACSFIKYLAAIIIVFMILSAWGVNTTALLAGIGILSLIVGLGAQPLIEDIIAGLFIVFEKTFDVGDIIVVDGFRGTVKEIGIRTTKIEDAGGDIKVMNNSDLRTIVNMTNELSLAICDVDIEYSESLERVEAVLRDNADKIRRNVPSIKNGPHYKGVQELGSSGVKLRIVAECHESELFQTERDLNRQIKLVFDKNNINIPFTQVVPHQPKRRYVPVKADKATLKAVSSKSGKTVLKAVPAKSKSALKATSATKVKKTVRKSATKPPAKSGK